MPELVSEDLAGVTVQWELFWRQQAQGGEPEVGQMQRWIDDACQRTGIQIDMAALARMEPRGAAEARSFWLNMANMVLALETNMLKQSLWGRPTTEVAATEDYWLAGSSAELRLMAAAHGQAAPSGPSRVLRFLDIIRADAIELLQRTPEVGIELALGSAQETAGRHPELMAVKNDAEIACRSVIDEIILSAVGILIAKPSLARPLTGAANAAATAAIATAGALALGDSLVVPLLDEIRDATVDTHGRHLEFASPAELVWADFSRLAPFTALNEPQYGPNCALVDRFEDAVRRLDVAAWDRVLARPFPTQTFPAPGPTPWQNLLDTSMEGDARRAGRWSSCVAAGSSVGRAAWAALVPRVALKRPRPSLSARFSRRAGQEQAEANTMHYIENARLACAAAQAAAALVLADASPSWTSVYSPFAEVVPIHLLGP